MVGNLADYGVPQNRKRAFLTFIRRGEPELTLLQIENRAPYPRPTHASSGGDEPHVTLKEALAEMAGRKLDARTRDVAGKGLHSVPIWSARRYAMVAAIPPNSGRSAWENKACEHCGKIRVGRRAVLCPRCRRPLLRPVVEKSRGGFRFIKGFRSTSYRRMKPNEPAPTITTASGHVGSDVTIHPTENRLLSPAECAHLQTFPKRFRWGKALALWGPTNVRDMIGEAVPPLFTRLHGVALMGVLTGRWHVAAISQVDPRCKLARSKLRLPEPGEKKAISTSGRSTQSRNHKAS